MYGLAGDFEQLTWSVSRNSMFQPPTSRQNQHVMDLAKEDKLFDGQQYLEVRAATTTLTGYSSTHDVRLT